MVVTCENCEAKYALDETQIPGRGVRTTCKKCNHVFVIYRPTPEEDIDIGIDDSVAQNNSDPRVDSKAEGNLEFAKSPEESQEESAVLGVFAEDLDIFGLNALELDFSEVGIKSWKVKTGFGLIYESRDYKGIDKFLRDGKAKMSDIISYDGVDWVRIDEIPDLKEYFCRIYSKLKNEGGLKEKPQPTKPRKEGRAMVVESGIGELASVLADAEAEVEGRDVPMRPKRKPSAKQRSSSSSKGSKNRPVQVEEKKGGGLLVGILLLAALGGGYVFLGQDSSVDNSSTPIQQNQEKSASKPEPEKDNQLSELARQKAELRQKIAKGAQDVQPEKEEPATPEEDLQVQVPEEVLRARKAALEEQSLAKSDQETPSSAPSSTKSASDYASDGASALDGGNWNVAVLSYQKALKMAPQQMEYQEKYGYSLFKAGRFADAKRWFSALKGRMASANKYLGYIAQAEGDIAARNQHFQLYLQSNPPDKAEIEQVMMSQ